ncbi:MAG: hypothetical protein K5842_04045 [Bacteroidales bacterium]|nr:hypothetical protein [Bacteroidales bacterium]
MKKATRFLAIVTLSAGLLMVGCEKEEINDNSGGGNNGGGSNNTNVEWVDLGLPSGLLWASCNVGASAPEEYGDYFAWGETTTKDNYTWSTYRYCTVDGEGNMATLTKYNTPTNWDWGTVDNLTTLESSDDVATVSMGDGARTPTYDEWNELLENTTAEWTTLNDVNGTKFIAPNGNSIFLPAAGYHVDSELEYAGSYGLYWSSSLDAVYPHRARSFLFNMDDQRMGYDYRYDGRSVRAVRAAE